MFLLTLHRQILPQIVALMGPKMRRWCVERIPMKSVQEAVKIIDVMDQTSREIFEDRKAALREGKYELSEEKAGKDIITNLCERCELNFLDYSVDQCP